MFKGFTNELKTKIEAFNRNSKRFIFCLSDLQKSSDRGRNQYGDEEQKFDILSPELQQKLAETIGVSNPKAIKFIDTLMRDSENIFSAPPCYNTHLKLSSGVNKFEVWIMFKKKGQKKSLADLNKNNNTRTIYMPGDPSYKWEVKFHIFDYFWPHLADKPLLKLLSTEGGKIMEAEKEARKKHAENISKVSSEALEEIKQTLLGCSLDIATAEIDWMAILPDWCSCEVRGISENNTLHQKHIQNCLWREASEIKTFKDEVVKAILRKGGNNFRDYKNRIIQEIIQKAKDQGISETELNNTCSNWQNYLLSLNRLAEITDYRTNYLEKDIEKLVAAKKNKSDSERQQAENEAKKNAQKEEERLKKEQEEREKKEAEEKAQKEKEEAAEKDKAAKEQAKQQELKQKRDKVITEITAVLNQEPNLTNNELSPEYQNWEAQINQLTDIQPITNLQDRLLADIQARRHDKKTAQKVKENLNKARTGTSEQKEQAFKDLEEQETQKSYQENKAEVENLKKEKAAENPQQYSEEAKQKIEKKLKNNGVSEAELSQENQTQWQKLKTGEIKDPQKLVEIETKITQNIYQKGVQKKVANLTSQVNQILKSNSNEKSQIAALKKELLEFISSSNIYYSEAHKKEVGKLLTQLENHSTINNDQNTSKPENFPWKIVIPLLVIGLSIILVIPLVRKRIKTKKKNRIK